MKLSTRSRYGIRSLIDLSKNYESRPVSVKDISTRQKISERYLENIFNDLKNAGILGSVKGKGGGFYLERPIESVTIFDIIEVLEGTVMLVSCDDENGACKMSAQCYTRGMWKNLNEKLRESMKQIKLIDVIDMNHGDEDCFV